MDTSLSAAERFDALKFVIHFVGDIHQPLHDEALDVGGNTINVTLSVYSTSLPLRPSNKYSVTRQ
jgi:hypothetical protein